MDERKDEPNGCTPAADDAVWMLGGALLWGAIALAAIAVVAAI